MTKKVLLSLLALGTFLSVTTLTVSKVFAEDSKYTHPVISRLAERFNLNEGDVEAVFDAVKEEKLIEMKQSKQERLNQAVADGVVTEEQLTALTEKWQEMKLEWREEKEQHHEEMEAWFDEQGIDHEALMEYGGFKGHKGMMGMHGMKFHK